MAAPYSLDLRKRVVAAVAAGMSRARAAFIGDPLDQASGGNRQPGSAPDGWQETLRTGRSGSVDTRPCR